MGGEPGGAALQLLASIRPVSAVCAARLHRAGGWLPVSAGDAVWCSAAGRPAACSGEYKRVCPARKSQLAAQAQSTGTGLQPSGAARERWRPVCAGSTGQHQCGLLSRPKPAMEAKLGRAHPAVPCRHCQLMSLSLYASPSGFQAACGPNPPPSSRSAPPDAAIGFASPIAGLPPALQPPPAPRGSCPAP